MTAPKRGDRVRVVLEGEVRRADVEPSGVRLVFGYDSAVYTTDEHVVSVDILCPPAKVGDIIETSAGFDSLPLWAVVLEGGPDEHANAYRRSYAGWSMTGSLYLDRPTLPVTVLYLPDGPQ